MNALNRYFSEETQNLICIHFIIIHRKIEKISNNLTIDCD